MINEAVADKNEARNLKCGDRNLAVYLNIKPMVFHLSRQEYPLL